MAESVKKEPDHALQTQQFKQEIDGEKVDIQLEAVGSAPKLKIKNFKVNKFYPFAKLIAFVRNQLKKAGSLGERDTLVLYVNSSFSPAPHERIADIYDGFKAGQLLVINYSIGEAWG